MSNIGNAMKPKCGGKISATLFLLGFLLSGSVYGQNQQENSAEPQNTGNTVSPIVERLKSLGFSHCLSQIDRLTSFVINGGQHNAIFYYDETRTDRNLVSFLVGRSGENQNYLATMDFVQNEQCSATYEITRVWSDSCDKVMAAEFADYVEPLDLPGGFQIRNRGPHLHVAARSLAAEGCLTVQKEVIF